MLRGAGDLDNWTLKAYQDKWEGYEALRKALKHGARPRSPPK